MRKKVPYDVNDRKKLKEKLSLYFEPSPAIHIIRSGFRKGCTVRFIPPRTSSGVHVSNKRLKNLFEENIIEERYDSNLNITFNSDDNIEEDIEN